MGRPPAWLTTLAVLAVATVAIPLVYLGVRASEVPLSEVMVILSRPLVGELLLNTMGLSIAVSATAIAMGTVIVALAD